MMGAAEQQAPLTLEGIFQNHMDNTLLCHSVLHNLFQHLDEPLAYIDHVKQLENIGDQLTADAYGILETWELSGLTHITEDLVKHLDDIIDGFNKTARLIDIFHSDHIEVAAYDIMAAQKIMLESLRQEFEYYPNNDLSGIRNCCIKLKAQEETVDQIYHEWRRKERRVLELSLIDEFNWTELFSLLEQTTDDIYHTALLLERLTKYRHRENRRTAQSSG